MSFLAGNNEKVPQPSQKPFGADAYRSSTNEQARPVPYLAGKRRLAVTWISDHFNDRADAIYQTIGKQKTKQGYNYFSSAAAIACTGPVDALFNIYFNGESVYASSVRITIVSLTRVSGTATASTATAHGLTSGDEIQIEGALQAEYNGVVVVTVTGANTFTFSVIGVPVSPATGSMTARLVLEPVYRDGDNPDYVDILIPDYGNMRIYWGTETQTADFLLNNSGVNHPSYRGLCYLVFDQIFLGFNQTNFPNVELVLGRWPKPASEWHELDAIDEEVNPVAFICDILQHPRCGFRVSDAMLNTTELLATAALLEAEDLSFSPLINRQSETREILTRALEYIDGYFTTDNQGRLGLRLARVAGGAVPEIGYGDLVAPVEFSPEDWSTIKTGVNIKFTNREVAFLADVRQYRDAAALRIKGERDVETIDREWFTRPDVAESFAQVLGRTRTLPRITGKAKLRLSGTIFSDLSPGALFTFDLSNRDTSNLMFRVEERTLPTPAKPEFEITFKLDRSYLHP